MKIIKLLAPPFIALMLFACAPKTDTKTGALTDDFFHGTWIDSVKSHLHDADQGIIFEPDKDFYFFMTPNKTGGDHYLKGLRLTYNLVLDPNLVTVEIITRDSATNQEKMRAFGKLKVIDDRHLIWMPLDEKGIPVDSAKMVRGSK